MKNENIIYLFTQKNRFLHQRQCQNKSNIKFCIIVYIIISKYYTYK